MSRISIRKHHLPGYFFLILVFVFASLHQPCGVDAASVAPLTPDQQFQYATACFQEGDYLNAVSEFKRFIYFFPDDPRVETARYKIGMSYFHTRNYTGAVGQFSKLMKLTGPDKTGISCGFMISDCYRMLNDYPSAIDTLYRLAGLTGDGDTHDRIYYHLGLLYLESGDFLNARAFFNKISPKNRSRYRVDALFQELDRGKDMPRKSPVLAGLASIIPGGGYLYCKRYKDALFSFLVNTALGYASYESIDKDLYALGGMIALVETGFYAGNIYGGISSARKYNRARQNEFIDNFKKQFGFDLYSGLNADGIVFSVNYRF